jgi:arginase
MGAGPLRLLDDGVGPLGRGSEPVIVRLGSGFHNEIASAFEIHRRVAEAVGAAVSSGKMPLVLSGNCNVAVGTTAGLGSSECGVVWFDAHGDFNTPNTTTSGFFDGMGLATLAGLCWDRMAASVPNFRAIAGSNIIHIGGRDVSEAELTLMRQSGVELYPARDLVAGNKSRGVADALARLSKRASAVYLHLDLDVIDPADLRANEFSPPGGLSLTTIVQLLREIRQACRLAAVGIASYDPAQDFERRGPGAVRALLEPFGSDNGSRERDSRCED